VVTSKTWTEAFYTLYECVKEKPAHIVFDEFQWMANYRREIVTELKPVWDQYLSKIEGLSLILCGSIASFMTTKVIKSNAFFGRIDLMIHLKSFSIDETKKMLKGKGLQEIIEAHLLTGGVPKYLELLNDKSSIHLGMNQLAFEKTGYLFTEYERIFTSHFGHNPDYETIIKVLSEYPAGLFRKDIARLGKLEIGGLLTEHLNNLEAAGFIQAETPIDKAVNSRLIKYCLSDAYLRFYFTFIRPKTKAINLSTDNDIFGMIRQSGHYYNWMGKSFEYFCHEHAARIAQFLGFSGINYTYGSYFRNSIKNRPGVQVDLIFNRSDNVITLCEINYRLKTVGIDIIDEVEQKIDKIRDTFHNKTFQKILITLRAPSKRLLDTGYFYKVISIEDFVNN